MDNDMITRRVARLTLAGRDHLVEIQEAMAADDHARIPAIVERMRELPPADQGEIMELLALLGRAAEAEASRLADAAAEAEKAERVLIAARDKLAGEGKPVDPGMTVREAYEVLGR